MAPKEANKKGFLYLIETKIIDHDRPYMYVTMDQNLELSHLIYRDHCRLVSTFGTKYFKSASVPGGMGRQQVNPIFQWHF